MNNQINEEYLKTHSPFVGVIVDNYEPDQRRGFCRVRVLGLHDDIKDEELPWAEPRGGIDGKEFRLPEIGTIVNVFYPTGSLYHPEYSTAIHFNPNLQHILDNSSKDDYLSTTAFLVDDTTQFYVNDNKGLNIEYKNSTVNIDKESNIKVLLSDKKSKFLIGDEKPDQPIILGKNFMDWFSKFISHLSGSFGGPYLGNFGAPILANPLLLNLFNEFKVLKEQKFLSHNIIAVDNGKIIKRKWDKKGKNSGIIVKKTLPKIKIKKNP